MKFSGSIVITTKVGQYGPFNVGAFSTDIGEFLIKNELLDQFDEGSYDVDVSCTQIYLGGFNWGATRRVTELCMNIDYIQSNSESSLPDNIPEFGDMDPLLTDSTNTNSVQAQPQDEPDVNTTEQMLQEDDPVAILGEELALLCLSKQPVKLDPSIGRVKMRSQTTFLKSNGYRYDGQNQVWNYQVN